MLRITFILMSLFAVVGVSAIASTSALAAPHFLVCLEVAAGTGSWLDSNCLNAGKGNWEKKEVTTSLKIEGTSGLSKLSSEIQKVKVVIVCTKDTFKGEIEAGGASKATITYEGCSVEKSTKCTVPNITANVTDKLIENGAKEIEDEFKEVGGEFATVRIEGCTGLEGKYKVKGTQKCLLPEGTVFKRLHNIECKTTGSSLTLEGVPATYEGNASLELANKDAWAVSG